MAFCLVGAKPLSEPMLVYCQLHLRNKFQWNLKQNTYIFIHENVFEFENVWEMASILCLGLNVLNMSIKIMDTAQ